MTCCNIFPGRAVTWYLGFLIRASNYSAYKVGWRSSTDTDVYLCLVAGDHKARLSMIGGIGTDTGCAGCGWVVGMSVQCEEHTLTLNVMGGFVQTSRQFEK